MRETAAVPDHTRRWPSPRAILEVGAAVRTLVARLVTGVTPAAPVRRSSHQVPDPE